MTIDPALLQQLATDPAAGKSMLRSMIAERAAADPQMAMLMQLLDRNGAASEPHDDRDDEDPERPSRAQRIRARVQAMREELVELHQRNHDLADALGACPVCWGRVSRCEECHGRGRPGWRAPVPSLFEDLVAPAVARRRGDVTRSVQEGDGE